METITNNNHEQLSIQVIHISVCVAPEIYVEIDEDSNSDTSKKQMSTEEKRRLFYKKRIENITKCLTFLDTN